MNPPPSGPERQSGAPTDRDRDHDPAAERRHRAKPFDDRQLFHALQRWLRA